MSCSYNPYKPIPWPRRGEVEKLFLNIAKGQADVFVHQKAWPRQPQNPLWRIEVTNLDGRLSETNRAFIREACLETARIYLGRWLAAEAPLLTLEAVTWPEMVRLATQSRYGARTARPTYRPAQHRYRARPSLSVQDFDLG